MKIGKYIVGLVSGLTFGMLFAPKKGSRLRDEIKKKKSRSKQDAFQALVGAFKEAGMEAVDETKKLADNGQLGEAVEMSKEKMREYFSQIEETGYDIAARAKEKLEEIQGMAKKEVKQTKKRVTKTATKAKKKAKRTVKKATKKATVEVKDAKKKVKKAAGTAKKMAKKKVTKK